MNRLDQSSDLRAIYEKLTRATRWLVIIFVGSTMWFLPYDQAPLVALLVIAVAYNALHHLRGFSESKALRTKWFAILTNFLIIALLIIFTGEINSPYIPLLILTVLMASYWYGYVGLLASVVLNAGLLVALSQLGSHWRLSTLTVAATMAILGLYLARLSTMDESDRAKLLQIDSNLQVEQAKLLTLVNSLGEAIFAVDIRGNVILYNSAALELLDTHYDIMNKSFIDAVHLVDEQGVEVYPTGDVLEKGKLIIRDDLTLKTTTYSPNVYVHITPISEHGKQTGAMVLIRDISRQKTFENQKDEFVSIISHELRTPVAIVEANVSTALLPGFADIPDKAKKVLTDAQKNLIFLSGLLRDLSDLARSERAVLDTEIMPFNPSELVRDIVNNFEPQVLEAGHTIISQVNTDIPPLTTSRQRVEEILVNYMTNAVKYSGRATTITVGLASSTKLKNGVQFYVKDEGMGMRKADLANVYKKFFRAANKQTQAIKGTGMGLYIVKKQAESMGGTVWAESTYGKGSIFYLELPIELPKSQKLNSTK